MKKITIGGFMLAALFVVLPQSADAACFYPNFEDRNSRCVAPDYNSGRTNNYLYQTPTPNIGHISPAYYGNTYQSQLTYINELQQLLARLQELRAQQNAYVYTYTYPQTYTSYNSSNNSRLSVSTERATDIDEDSAELNGEIDFNREDEAEVWFQWGESRNDLDEDTRREDIDEDDDENFSARIDDLDEDETYYFRAVARDEDGRRTYGAIRSFTTDDDRDYRDDEPEIETEDAEDIRDDSAELYGELDMKDFDDGIAFFVYGEDEDQVKDVEDDYDEYRDVDEDGDDLQKVFIDDNIDGSIDARADIRGLDDDTDIYFAFCVEYEDEDDDEVIMCGDVEEFTTDD